jgi:hypothetical protein
MVIIVKDRIAFVETAAEAHIDIVDSKDLLEPLIAEGLCLNRISRVVRRRGNAYDSYGPSSKVSDAYTKRRSKYAV